MSDLELAEKYFEDTLLFQFKSDYKYYAFFQEITTLNYDQLSENKTLGFIVCFFNDGTIELKDTFGYNISTCDLKYKINVVHRFYDTYSTTLLDISQEASNGYSTISDSYLKTNYFELQNSDSGSDSNVSLNVDTLIPYFLVLATLLCLIFFSLVFRRR